MKWLDSVVLAVKGPCPCGIQGTLQTTIQYKVSRSRRLWAEPWQEPPLRDCCLHCRTRMPDS